MNRRAAIIVTLIALAVAFPLFALSSCTRQSHPKVIVIGFDGLDPVLCERMMDEGRLPNFAKLRQGGGYSRLGTSIPPQSPVAWSNFITGADPGAHGIFDFVHRDPQKNCEPYYSAARTIESNDGWEVGKHKLPLTFWPFNHNPTQTLLKRQGTPFWDYLDQAGIPTRIYDIPSNYPPSPSHHGHVCCLSGMGVPDLLGTYGTYQYFAEDVPVPSDEEGGKHHPITFRENRCKAVLVGPKNTMLKNPKDAKIEFEIHRHPAEPTARIEFQGQTIALKQGEWSDWHRVDFVLEMPPFLPDAHAGGIVRFFLKQVRPKFQLYVSPINIDPSDPGDQQISEPPDFVSDISDDLGLFYTAGFQEDHKAFSNRVFNQDQYREQASIVLSERLDLMTYAHENYEDGLLFFYFSSTDLQAHMLWWEGDQPHPTRSPEDAQKGQQAIEDLYVQMDKIVGDALTRHGDSATVLVMSDHGFANFGRQFNLNRWLRDNGYIQPAGAGYMYADMDWSQTKAYGLGLNGLYLNLKGREFQGIVEPSERDALLEEISEKLLEVRDPQNGKPVVARVYRADEVYRGPHAAEAPDLIVGYHRNYRSSWIGSMGYMNEDVVTDNNSAWSADHCMAAEEVPGVIFSNRRIAHPAPALIDVAPTILQHFGLEIPATMTGSSIFRNSSTAQAASDESANE